MAKRDAIEVEAREVDPYAPSPANRARAAKLRIRQRADGVLPEDDAVWLAGYEDARGVASEARQARGASRAHKVSYTEESAEAASEGDTSGADVQAMQAAGTMAREEGRRYDSLIGVSITAMARVAEMYDKMMTHILVRNNQLETAHIGMMNAYRENFLSRVEAEADLATLQREAENGDKDSISQLADMLLPILLPKLEGAGPKG
jgi:hypothetical protein